MVRVSFTYLSIHIYILYILMYYISLCHKDYAHIFMYVKCVTVCDYQYRDDCTVMTKGGVVTCTRAESREEPAPGRDGPGVQSCRSRNSLPGKGGRAKTGETAEGSILPPWQKRN